ncbi:Biotin carboxyl carrier protein of acetyl-CoA carboxylase [Aquicella siphonis]|uniref:Biotin carboxyl carrier protein of acetyl-CoA carboxylase n=1 Tax=Aquicella siphonis TaxID=254247 RepID=A0A5E4PI24_9COXI|nr:acetyl-CoA carboxylase biotin carboxyl carrier protein [Aquicella siphonis]VVC76669.1 Biotin carboxyl carrier protein of acetyl-CoA carboxylase [Aquicella siphonis]
MDMRKIKKLIELIQSTGVAEIEIREGEESVRITREVHTAAPVMMAPPVMPAAAVPPPALAAPEPAPAKAAEAPAVQDKHMLKAPMVGTVYLSSTPGAKPFVEIGQSVKAGDVICLIEAMKMFNQIEADKTGTITARLVDNGTPVEFNQPLFVIE